MGRAVQRSGRAVIGLVLLVLVPVAASDATGRKVERWIDAQGNVHYGEGPAATEEARRAARAHPHAANGVLDVAVVVDRRLTPPPSAAEVDRLLALAAARLAERTGERMRVVDVAWDLARDDDGSRQGTYALVERYVHRAQANPPEGIVAFTPDEDALASGGLSFMYRPRFAFVNEYPTPARRDGDAFVYVAVIDIHHWYARCGYNEKLERVSAVSVGGECRNRPGQPCVQHGGRWVCADAVRDEYMGPGVFAAAGIVHELLHPFGAEGNLDHYGTPSCYRRGAMPRDEDARALGQWARFNGLCPDLYQRFRRGPAR